MLAERPGNREAVAEHRERMLSEVRAYKLRELREKYELTQAQFASEIHVSQRRVSAIEHGDIEAARVDTLRRYVEALGGKLKIEVTVGEDSYQIA
ncbi:MAG: helix-turn-helix domain-containing protein [Nocardioidaceae bacterium]